MKKKTYTASCVLTQEPCEDVCQQTDCTIGCYHHSQMLLLLLLVQQQQQQLLLLLLLLPLPPLLIKNNIKKNNNNNIILIKITSLTVAIKEQCTTKPQREVPKT